jgi:hypothetical protein
MQRHRTVAPPPKLGEFASLVAGLVVTPVFYVLRLTDKAVLPLFCAHHTSRLPARRILRIG